MTFSAAARLPIALRLALGAALAACGGGRSILVTELVPGEAPPRAPEGVEIYRNAPPRRPFTARYVIDLSTPVPPEPAALVRYREVGGNLGCDAVVVYTGEHPTVKSGPASEDQALVLSMDGRLEWRAIGVTVPERRTFLIEGPNKVHAVDAATVALCLEFGDGA